MFIHVPPWRKAGAQEKLNRRGRNAGCIYFSPCTPRGGLSLNRATCANTCCTRTDKLAARNQVRQALGGRLEHLWKGALSPAMELQPASSKRHFTSLRTPRVTESKSIHEKYIVNNSTHTVLICMWINPIYGHKGRLCQCTEDADKSPGQRRAAHSWKFVTLLHHLMLIHAALQMRLKWRWQLRSVWW